MRYTRDVEDHAENLHVALHVPHREDLVGARVAIAASGDGGTIVPHPAHWHPGSPCREHRAVRLGDGTVEAYFDSELILEALPEEPGRG
jgi:hypothetical protein